MVNETDNTFCVYIGPSIEGLIAKGSIFIGSKQTVLAQLAPALARYPQIAAMVISAGDVAQARQDVETPGTLLHMQYRKFFTANTKSE